MVPRILPSCYESGSPKRELKMMKHVEDDWPFGSFSLWDLQGRRVHEQHERMNHSKFCHINLGYGEIAYEENTGKHRRMLLNINLLKEPF